MSERIACSPITGRIYSGRISKDKTHFVGVKRDVTSDVLRALVEKAEFHGGAFEIDCAGNRWVVTVKEGGGV